MQRHNVPRSRIGRISLIAAVNGLIAPSLLLLWAAHSLPIGSERGQYAIRAVAWWAVFWWFTFASRAIAHCRGRWQSLVLPGDPATWLRAAITAGLMSLWVVAGLVVVHISTIEPLAAFGLWVLISIGVAVLAFAAVLFYVDRPADQT